MEKNEKIVKKLEDVKGQVKVYRKRPVEVRAVELKEKVAIKTREGTLYGKKGEFLIEGIQGEVYPCGRTIFFKTYEEVNKDAKEKVVLAEISKKDGKIGINHSRDAQTFELYGFLKIYLENLEEELSYSLEPDDEEYEL